jgi:hypothetical protein
VGDSKNVPAISPFMIPDQCAIIEIFLSVVTRDITLRGSLREVFNSASQVPCLRLGTHHLCMCVYVCVYVYAKEHA